MTNMSSQFEHEKYEELCALATAGILTPEESRLLTAHLDSCHECREAFAQYQHVATSGMSFLAGQFAESFINIPFDESSTLAQLIRAADGVDKQAERLTVMPKRTPFWDQSWVRGLVAASFLAAVGVGAYEIGMHSSSVHLQNANVASQSPSNSVLAEKQALEKTIRTDNARIAALEQQMVAYKSDLANLRADAKIGSERLSGITEVMSASEEKSDVQRAALTEERDTNANKLRDTETMYRTAQEELNTLRSQHEQDLLHLASAEARVDSLSASLNEQNKVAKTEEQYLASDKDIRNLIGARNLYIADIMDVSDSGQSKKPFGRVFYTKTKSLIFYAYDLDRQPGVMRTSTFQVWGRTSANDRHPINLGILYMDSESNQRWTLRVDNPEQLARLDAVFVTIEPHEQPEKPSSKPFLYASLRREPNHP